MALLEMKNLSYHVSERRIIDGLSLAIDAGEVHSLIGTNGTGKSTLACLIMGCGGCRPSEGEILFAGSPINDLAIHERAAIGITMAWQEPARFEGLTVREYLSLKNPDGNPAGRLAMVGLEPARYLDRFVDKALSGGERKRIELASMLALYPPASPSSMSQTQGSTCSPPVTSSGLSGHSGKEGRRSFSSPTARRSPAWRTGRPFSAADGSSAPAPLQLWRTATANAAASSATARSVAMHELETILDALREIGEDRSILEAPGTAHIVVDGNAILSARSVPVQRIPTTRN